MSDRFGNIPIQPPESSPPEKKPTKKITRSLPVPKIKGKVRSGNKKYIWPGIATAVLLVCLYSALGFLGFPYYVSKILPEQFHAKTGMVLVPTTVSLNPFTFQLETGALQILSESGIAIVSLQSLFADLAPASLLRLNIVCNSVTLDKVDLNIAREIDGSYNFQQIFGDKKNSSPSELFNLANLPFFFSLNNISITNSSIKFNDAPAGKNHSINKIQLNLPTFSTIPFQTDQYLRPHFSAVINGSPIEMSGQAHMGEADGKNQATKLSLDIHDLDLTIYAGYLPFSLPMEFNKGTANGKIDLLFDPQNKNTDKLSIDFQLQISEAELYKENESIDILIPTARLRGNLQPVSRTLHLTELAIKNPLINSFGTSFLDNMKNPANLDKQAATVDSVKTAPYNMVIDQLLLNDGIVRLFQEKKDQQPTSTWSAIQLSVKDYNSSQEDLKELKSGSFSLSGEMDGSSSDFSWQGTVSQADSLTGSLSISKMDSSFLLKSIDSDHPFTLKGFADLKGQLIISPKKDQPTSLSYKLVDAEISIEDFSLLEKEKSILTAQIVKIAPLSCADESLNFGNIYFKKATAEFTYGHIPKLFATFNTDKYRLQGIDFEGKITLNPEEKSGKPITFTEVSLKANELDSSQKAPNNLSASGKTEAGGIFKAQGNISLSPFSMAIKTGFFELPLINVLPFFTSSPSLQEIKGNLSGKGNFKLPAKSFVGELQLTKITGNGPQKSPFSWQKAIFQNLNYTAKPFHLGMSSAKIDQAQFSWEITRNDNNPMQFLTNFCKKYFPEIEKRSPDKPRITISPIDIQEISFANCKINIHDRRLTPTWQAEVTGFAGQIKDIHSAAGNGKSRFSFTGKLDDTPFSVDGAMDPFSQENNGTFRFSLEKYPLGSFHKQLSSKTEVNTSKGELMMTLDGTWRNQQYISSGNVALNNIEAVSTTSDLALPLALLTGLDDTLQLDFDFSRTEPVAKTALIDEILTSFQTQLIKGTVSPLLLAKGNFTDLIDNEYIEFRPGEFMFSDTGREVLARYVALLTAHPHVGLVLSGGFDKNIDRLAMRENLTAIEQLRVGKANEKLFKRWQEQKALYEEKLAERQKNAGPTGSIVEQDIPAEVLAGFTPILPVPITVDNAMLLELAHKRINILYQHFTKQLALQPGRISLIMPDEFTAEPGSPSNGVVLTLKAIGR